MMQDSTLIEMSGETFAEKKRKIIWTSASVKLLIDVVLFQTASVRDIEFLHKPTELENNVMKRTAQEELLV